MRRLRAFFVRILGVFARKRREGDFAAELDSHLQLHIDDNMRAGMTPGEARRQALAALGGLEQTKESVRDARGTFLDSIRQDAVFALRLMRRSPGVTAMAVLSLALGIGANTTIFSFYNAFLLGTPPVEEPGRLIAVYTADGKNPGQFLPISLANYENYRDRNQVFSGLAAHMYTQLNLSTQGAPELVGAGIVSANYFDVLGVKAAVGRTFELSRDLVEGKYSVVVLSDHFWKRRFGANRYILGKEIVLNQQRFKVIGVAPRGFNSAFVLTGPDLYVPLGMHEQVLKDFYKAEIHDRRALFLSVLGRLKPGVSLPQARAGMQTIAQQLEQSYPKDNEARTAELMDFRDTLISPEARDQALLAGDMMMGVVCVVLLIACANVANLLLARAATRQREISIRLALGACRARLVRQLLTESMLLAAAAGLLGLLIAGWGRDLLWWIKVPMIDAEAVEAPPLDSRVLLFTVLITFIAAVLFGAAPALQASRVDLAWTLKERVGLPRKSAGRFHLRSMLVAFQVALSLVALTTAGIFLRSLQFAWGINVGFEKTNLVSISFDLAGQRYTESHGREFYRQATERLRQVPEVKAVALSSNPPLRDGNRRTVFAEGQDMSDGRNGHLTMLYRVSPGYFETIGMPLVRGRGFSDQDKPGAPMVAVVNQSMARRLWPGEDALGKRFRCYGEDWILEVVGIARDAKYRTLGEAPMDFMYFPLLQHYVSAVSILVRTEGDPSPLVGILRDRAQSLDKSLPIVEITTIGSAIETILWLPRIGAILLSVFGALALLLAAMGIHGVMSYAVVQRTREIGIRMAMGAKSADVLRLVLRQVLVILMIGNLVGLVGAYVVSRLLSSLLYGVGGRDLLPFWGTTVLLLAVALLAGYLPARRATRIHPRAALQYE